MKKARIFTDINNIAVRPLMGGDDIYIDDTNGNLNPELSSIIGWNNLPEHARQGYGIRGIKTKVLIPPLVQSASSNVYRQVWDDAGLNYIENFIPTDNSLHINGIKASPVITGASFWFLPDGNILVRRGPFFYRYGLDGVQTSSFRVDYNSIQPNKISIVNSSLIFASGFNYIFPDGVYNAVFISTDGGVTWSNYYEEPAPNTIYPYSILGISQNEVILGYDDGVVKKTTDGGLSWTIYNIPNVDRIFYISILDDGSVCYVGTGSVSGTTLIYKTLSVNDFNFVHKHTISNTYTTLSRGENGQFYILTQASGTNFSVLESNDSFETLSEKISLDFPDLYTSGSITLFRDENKNAIVSYKSYSSSTFFDGFYEIDSASSSALSVQLRGMAGYFECDYDDINDTYIPFGIDVSSKRIVSISIEPLDFGAQNGNVYLYLPFLDSNNFPKTESINFFSSIFKNYSGLAIKVRSSNEISLCAIEEMNNSGDDISTYQIHTFALQNTFGSQNFVTINGNTLELIFDIEFNNIVLFIHNGDYSQIYYKESIVIPSSVSSIFQNNRIGKGFISSSGFYDSSRDEEDFSFKNYRMKWN